MGKKLDGIIIYRDSRENQGWIWDAEEKKPSKLQVLGTEVVCLDAGDYSVKGYEDLIRIERKMGFSELFGNMLPKENRERFEREMEKLRPIPHKWIVIETNLSNDIMGLSVPQMYRGPCCSAVLKWLIEIQIQYGVPFIFAGDAGKKVTRQLLELAVRRVNANI